MIKKEQQLTNTTRQVQYRCSLWCEMDAGYFDLSTQRVVVVVVVVVINSISISISISVSRAISIRFQFSIANRFCFLHLQHRLRWRALIDSIQSYREHRTIYVYIYVNVCDLYIERLRKKVVKRQRRRRQHFHILYIFNFFCVLFIYLLFFFCVETNEWTGGKVKIR